MIEVFIMIKEYLLTLAIAQENILGFSDSSFWYAVDDKSKYSQLMEQGLIIQMPAAIKADKAIIAYCLKHDNAVFISQDLMREYYVYLPYDKWIVERRICALIIGDEIYLIPMLEKVPEESVQGQNAPDNERETLDVLKDIESSDEDSEWNLFAE